MKPKKIYEKKTEDEILTLMDEKDKHYSAFTKKVVLNFAVRLNDLIAEKKISLSDLDQELKERAKSGKKNGKKTEPEGIHITDAALSKCLQGGAESKIATVVTLADYFGVTTDYLLGKVAYRSTEPNEQKVLSYLGLSDEATKKLHHLTHDKDNPLYPYIIDYLVKSGEFENLLSVFQKCLINREQYSMLYGDEESELKSIEESTEYQFNKDMMGLYRKILPDLTARLKDRISDLAIANMERIESNAIDTMYRMKEILQFCQKWKEEE